MAEAADTAISVMAGFALVCTNHPRDSDSGKSESFQSLDACQASQAMTALWRLYRRVAAGRPLSQALCAEPVFERPRSHSMGNALKALRCRALPEERSDMGGIPEQRDWMDAPPRAGRGRASEPAQPP